jgi:hypothetical protein
MLVSVHVPKTGGVSFLEVLKRCYGERLLLDYDDRPMAHGPVVRMLKAYVGGRFGSARELTGYDCVHGHFLPVKYRTLKDRSFAIWFRDPVELAVSRYHYFRRHLKPDDIQFRKYIRRGDLSLEEYCRIGHFHNVYAKYLVGMRLADFGFIGITEDYARSLAVFRRLYGIRDEVSEERMNANPDKAGPRYAIPDELRERIRGYNKKDVEIYRRATGLNRELQRRHLGNR